MQISMKRADYRLCVAGILLLSLAVLLKLSGTVAAGANAGKVLSTNEDFINGLGLKLDLSNPKEVFSFVFGRLGNEVTVYPTENYYYFEFGAQGKLIKGNIGLFADTRDNGEVNFGYEESSADDDVKGKIVKEVSFFAKDGIGVRRLSDFSYAITFQEKTVVFNLNQIEQRLPARIRLMPDEVFVGHSFDESGLKFFLIFNRQFNHLFWLLNDEEAMPETLTALTEDISVGNRTAFAFYIDKRNARKILIGVSDDAVKRNSWYDGPFDQLPDNYIATGQIEVKKYIEAAYPYAKGKIDKFGISLADAEDRIAISAYLRYRDKSELKELIADAKKITGRAASRFYCEITGI
jgi:hypothetical protein